MIATRPSDSWRPLTRRLLALGVVLAALLCAAAGTALPAQAAARVAVSSELGGATASATAATTVSLSGSGFQSVQGGFGGIYVLFGAVSEGWRPSEGGSTGTDYRYVPDSETKDNQGYQRFVTFPGSSTAGAANGGELAADGTWNAQMVIPGPEFDSMDRDGNVTRVNCLETQCGIITVGAHGVKNANNETFTAIEFTGAAPAAGEGTTQDGSAAADGAQAADGAEAAAPQQSTPSQQAAPTSAAPAPAAEGAGGAAGTEDPAAGTTDEAAAGGVAELGEAQVGLVAKEVAQSGALSFTARGFLPGEQVVGTLDNGTSAAGPYQAGASGEIAGSLPIPADLRAGTHVITLTGAASEQTARASFTVTAGAPAGSTAQSDGASSPGAWDIVMIVVLILVGLVLLVLLVAVITSLVRLIARRRAAERAAAAEEAAEREAERAAAEPGERVWPGPGGAPQEGAVQSGAPQDDAPRAVGTVTGPPSTEGANTPAGPEHSAGAGRRARQGAALGLALLTLGAASALSPWAATRAAAEEGDDSIELGVEIPGEEPSASLSWRVNDETGGGAFFGGCNFLVAGAVGDAGSSRVWDAAFAGANYETVAGDVTITKPDASGTQIRPSWSTKCRNASGTAVSTAAGSTSGNRVNLTGGEFTVDAEADTAEATWDGDFTIVYYGGMTYWTISDPVLTIEDGEGTLTGTASGYGADMHDPTKWVTLPETEIELATFSGVDVTERGVTITPDYAGVEVEGDDSGTFNPQNREKDGWGAFPQSWVDFNLLTGQSAYWYTSGGMVDPKKTAAPITISWDASDPVTPPEDGGGGGTDPGKGGGESGSGGTAPGGSGGSGAPRAQDGDRTLTDAQLRWGINEEATSGAFFGGCNFLVAGSVPDMGSSHVWSDAEGATAYKTSTGNVRLERDGSAPTWADRCKDSSGAAVSTTSTLGTGTEIVMEGGTGTLDGAPGAAGTTASVSWKGSFSVVFYGGMTYWWAKDPVLTVNADGTGSLTATVGGYGADMFDTSKWVALSTRTVTLATFRDVELTENGFSVTPDYRGVGVDASAGMNPQVKDAEYWGSFPQDFVDFQVDTGQSSYWYSSGGLRDRAKPPTPLTVSWDASSPQAPAASTNPGTASEGSGGAVLPGGGGAVTPGGGPSSVGGPVPGSGGTGGALPSALPAAAPVTTPVTPAALAAQDTSGDYALSTPAWSGGSLIPMALDAAFGTPLRVLGTSGFLGLSTAALIVSLRKGWLVLPGPRIPFLTASP